MQLHYTMQLHYNSFTHSVIRTFAMNETEIKRLQTMTTHIQDSDVSLSAESRLTERSQTTIPAAIRDALHLKPGEYIRYSLLAGGKVIMSRQEDEEDDPVVLNFLTFLENDMKKNPQNIHAVPVAVWDSIKTLTAGVEVDLDAPLTDD